MRGIRYATKPKTNSQKEVGNSLEARTKSRGGSKVPQKSGKVFLRLKVFHFRFSFFPFFIFRKIAENAERTSKKGSKTSVPSKAPKAKSRLFSVVFFM